MEYGSDYSVRLGELTYVEDNVFAYLKEFKTLFFDSGRSAIRYLLKSDNSFSVALPDYLCDSIVNCFSDLTVVYYSVDSNLQINDLDSIPWDKLDCFYLLHYFGTLQPISTLEYILEKKERYGFEIIEDTTHSFFTKPLTIGDYGVCSLRKWFPIPDGGVLYSKSHIDQKEYQELSAVQSDRIEGMVLKSVYLKEKRIDKSAFREILLRTEEHLDTQEGLYRMSPVSEFILRCQSVGQIVKRHRSNHATLEKAIQGMLPEIQKRTNEDVPFIYVTRLNDRDRLRSYLIQNQVYCPVHWPVPSTVNSQTAETLSEELISIPIDQRYGSDDVEKVSQLIKEYYNEQV